MRKHVNYMAGLSGIGHNMDKAAECFKILKEGEWHWQSPRRKTDTLQ